MGTLACRLQGPADDRPTRTGHPHLLALDGGVEIAAAPMLLEEGVESVEQGHARDATSGDGGASMSLRLQTFYLAVVLMVRCQRSSWSVQPCCFTFNQRRVGPASYRLASSLATRPS
jgi:hypothetical protein